MPVLDRWFRLRIRNATDTGDEIVLSSYPGDTNPYIISPPSGDGESFDPITGEPKTGSYTVQVADPETATNTRVVTAILADALARQKLLMRKAWLEQSEDGAAWPALVVGYLTALRLITAVAWEFGVGQSRRIEQSYTVWKEATIEFPGVTSVIGGPVIDGFIDDDYLKDWGGWTMEVDEDTAVHTKLALVTGFDPRKPDTDGDGVLNTFTSTSTAISDFTNDWARGFFEPTGLYTASNIIGHFPGLRVLLVPAVGAPITLVPLARPKTGVGVWYNPAGSGGDKLTGFGTSQLYLPKVDVDGAAFDPALGTEYQVYVYAVAISADNPLHYYGHPVDLWQSFRDEAGIEYDATVLPALKALIGTDVRLALRVTTPMKMSDADQKIIYGPFRLSSRIEDGKEVLFSTNTLENTPPVTTITVADVRAGDDGQPRLTQFDLDESTIITAATVKTDRIIPWTTDEADQPEIDSLISREAYPQTIENSADDIPPGATNEQVMGDIPGMIWLDGFGPVNLETFITNLGFEMFERAGRGFIGCELECLPTVTAKVGTEVLLDLPHLPGAVVGASPVSQRGIAPMPFQIVQRTESPEGPVLKLVNSLSGELADAVTPTFTLASSTIDTTSFGLVTITNAAALATADLNVRVDYALSSIASGAGTQFRTVMDAEMTGATFAFDLGPVTPGSTLYVQVRAEASGMRPGAYTAWQSVVLATAQGVTPGVGQLTATGLAPVVTASVFSPADIASLFTWHQADDITASNNDPIQLWDNAEGTAARDLFRSAFLANDPLYKSAPTGFNGMPALYFDGHSTDGGNNKFLEWGNIFSGVLTEGEAFIVAQLDADPPASANNVGFWGLGSPGGDSIPYTDGTIYDAFGTTVRKTTVNPTPSLASTFLYNVTSKSAEWTSRLNGTQIFTTATNTVGWTTTPRLGYSHNDTFLKGHIAEIIIFDAELSSGDRTSVKTYLADKYGITVA